MSQVFWREFDAKLRAQAAALAKDEDLAALARRVAAAAPVKRETRSVYAKVPWVLILALRDRIDADAR